MRKESEKKREENENHEEENSRILYVVLIENHRQKVW